MCKFPVLQGMKHRCKFTPHIYGELDKNTDITSKKSITSLTHSSTIFDLDNKYTFIFQNESASNPYSKYMLNSNIYVDDDAQSFQTSRKIITVSLHQGNIFLWVVTMCSPLELPKNNHSVTVPSTKVFLGLIY